MKIIIKKKAGTNQWNYPIKPQGNFPRGELNPDNSEELIVVNKSGLTLKQLNDKSDYKIIKYVPKIIIREKHMVSPIAIIVELPIGTEKKLEKIKADDPNIDGDYAARALMVITTGHPVNTNSETFDLLVSWLVDHEDLDITQKHIDTIRAL